MSLTTIGYAVLQIIPSLKGVSEAIEKELQGKVVDLNVKPAVDAKAAEQVGKETKAAVEKQTADVKVTPKVDKPAVEKAGAETKAGVEKHTRDVKVEPKVDKAAAEQAGKDAGEAAGKGAKASAGVLANVIGMVGGSAGTVLGERLAQAIPEGMTGKAAAIGDSLKRVLPAVTGAAGAAAGVALGVGLTSAAEKIAGKFGGSKMLEAGKQAGSTVARGLVDAVGGGDRLTEAGKSVARGLTSAVQKASASSDMAVVIDSTLTNGLSQASGVFDGVAAKITGTIGGIGEGIDTVKQLLGGDDSWAAPGLDFLTEKLGLAQPLLDGLATASQLAATGSQAMSVATGVAAKAQALLNVALTANPIGLVVAAIAALVAGLVLFFTKTEIGRKIWAKAWEGIKTAAAAVTKWFTETVVPVLKKAWEAIAAGAMWLWNNAIKPAWEGIKTVIGVAWNVIKGYFSVWMTVFKAAANAVLWLWNNAVVPAWNGIKAAIGVAWNLIKGYFDIWMSVYRKIGDVALWLWNNVMVPAWNGIKATISTAAGVIGTVVGKIKDFFQSLVTKAGEVWTGIKEKFTAVVDFVKGLPGKITDAAKGMWNGLKGGLVAVLNWISNKWNSFADGFKVHIPGTNTDVSLPHLPTIDPNGFAGGGFTGALPIKQIAGVVHGGEFVTQASSTKQIEANHPGLLEHMNRTGKLPGYDGGGFVPTGAQGLNPGAEYLRAMVLKNWPQITSIGGRRSEDGYGEHSSGNAIDIMIPGYKSAEGVALGNAVLSFLQKNGSALSVNGIIWRKLSYGYGGSLGAGKDYGEHGNDTLNHMDHLHVILGAGRGAGAPPVGLPKGALAGLSDSVKAKATPPADAPARTGAAPAPAAVVPASATTTGGFSLADSFSGLAGMGFNGLGAGVGTTQSGSDLSLFGKAAGSAVSGQVASALNVFGVGDSPGFLKAASQLVGGISIGGPTGDGDASPDKVKKKLYDLGGWLPTGQHTVENRSGGPEPILSREQWNTARQGMATAMAMVRQGGGQAQKASPTAVYNISTARVEDAFVRAQQQEKERAAAKLARY